MKSLFDIASTQIVRFGIVGVATLIVFYCAVASLVELVGSPPLTASAVSYVIAIIFNYIFHYKITFKGGSGHAYSLPRYLVVVTSGLLFNQALMYLGMEIAELHYLVAQGAAISVVISWNFIAFRFWAFAYKPS